MKIIVPVLTALSLLALPVAAQAQGTAPRSDPQPPAKDDTVHGTVKGTGRSVPTAPASPGVGGADDATANAARTNSQAARSGAVDGRNALSPGEGPTGPSGAPAVGTPR